MSAVASGRRAGVGARGGDAAHRPHRPARRLRRVRPRQRHPRADDDRGPTRRGARRAPAAPLHGQGGRVVDVETSDRRLAGIVAACQELPEQQLFEWVDDGGGRHVVESGDVNDSVAGASVRSEGTTLAQTGVDGNATVALSVSNDITYTVSAYGQTATTTVTGAVTNAAATAVGILLVLGILVRSGYRRGVRPQRIPGRVYRIVRRLVHGAVSALVAIAEAITGGVTAIRQLVEGVLTRAVALRAVPGRVLGLLAALGASLRSGLLGLPAALRATLARTTDDSSVATESAASPTARSGGQSEAQLTVRRAWREFLRIVPVRRVRRQTPGEVARRAIDTGLPAGPVTTLRDAYREVEYGGRDPDARLGTVRGALSTLTSEDDESERTDDDRSNTVDAEKREDGGSDEDGGER